VDPISKRLRKEKKKKREKYDAILNQMHEHTHNAQPEKKNLRKNGVSSSGGLSAKEEGSGE